MTQRKTVLLVEAISDDDCGMFRIGEIDTLPGEQVAAYIRQHGEFGYSELLDFAVNLIAAAKIHIQSFRLNEQAKAASSVPMAKAFQEEE
jgi:aminoglycoside phosphotransferase family enzyme